MNLDLSNYELSVRAWSCLRGAGINTVEDLCNQTEEDIIRIKNLGRRSLMEILDIMKQNGWKFKTE